MSKPLPTDEIIRSAMDAYIAHGNQVKAASELGVGQGTLCQYLKIARERGYSPDQGMEMQPPRVLIYDIETTPLISYTWGTFKQNVIKVIQESYILCFAYKWLGEKHTHIVALPQFEGHYKEDPTSDKKLVEKLLSLFDEADIVIAHNGDRFDQRKSKGRFLIHGLKPPSAFRTIDTLKIARRHFALHSNRLDSLGDMLGVGRKVQHTGFSLWEGCMNGDPASWQTMMKYNIQDVNLLEAVYFKLQGWIDNHPNMTVYSDDKYACPNCLSPNVVEDGFKYTQAGKYKQYHCQDCGRHSTSKSMEKGDKSELR